MEKNEGTLGEILAMSDPHVEDESTLSCSSSEFLQSETTGNEEHCHSVSFSSSPSYNWSVQNFKTAPCFIPSPRNAEDFVAPQLKCAEKDGSSGTSEAEMVKERLSKLLLGEDMSGSGNGVSTAMAISNAITNLSATVFGQLWRLEPLPLVKKSKWRQEMEYLLCITDHIVELKPSWHTYPDGSKVEVMCCRPRSDLLVNLPALRKLDNMLLEILDGFDDTEFWYIDQGVSSPQTDMSSLSRKSSQRQEEKWWLPVPQVPPCGLSEAARKKVQNKRDCANQILKAVTAINNITLADMDVPESYFESLPKHGRACLGELIHRNVTSPNFSHESLLTGLGISSEHQALEIANRVEAAIYVWGKRTNGGNTTKLHCRLSSKNSWGSVKEPVVDAERRHLLSDRAESLLHYLKQQFPGLPQTTLDTSKIQYNKDVGKCILESYSRVLESLAFNIVARIDDLLYVDDMAKQSDQISNSNLFIRKVCSLDHKIVPTNANSVPIPNSPLKTALTTLTPSISLAPKSSTGKGLSTS